LIFLMSKEAKSTAPSFMLHNHLMLPGIESLKGAFMSYMTREDENISCFELFRETL
jgi:hypothetical protein